MYLFYQYTLPLCSVTEHKYYQGNLNHKERICKLSVLSGCIFSFPLLLTFAVTASDFCLETFAFALDNFMQFADFKHCAKPRLSGNKYLYNSFLERDLLKILLYLNNV
jgi:hypothetical protein